MSTELNQPIDNYLSIVIPTREREKELREIVTDLANQTDQFFELIVIDASSKSKKGKIKRWLDNSGAKFDFQYLQTKAHLTYQRNIGVEHSVGELVGFLDDDLRINSTFVQKLKNIAAKEKKVSGFGGVNIGQKPTVFSDFLDRLFFLGGKGIFAQNGIKISGQAQSFYDLKKARESRWISGGGSFFRREVFKVVTFDERLKELPCRDDLDFGYRATKFYKFKIYPPLKFDHKASIAAREGSLVRTRNSIRNLIYYYRKNFSGQHYRFPFFLWALFGYFLKFSLLSLRHLDTGYLIGWIMGWHDALFNENRLADQTKILYIGSIPPPFTGVAVLNQYVVDSWLIDKFRLKFFDITDRRNLNNLGQFDLINLSLGLYHLIKLTVDLILFVPRAVYISISYTYWGFIRDSLFALLVYSFRKKIVVHFGGWSAFEKFYNKESPLMRKYIRFIYRRFTKIIFQSKRVEKKMVNWENSLAEKSVVFPNGIDTEFFDQYFSKFDNKKDQIIYLGPTTKEKGILELIKAFEIVKERFSNYQLIIMGEYSNRIGRKIEKLIKKGDLRGVRLVGIKAGKEKVKLLMESQIFSLPSYSESFSLATAEAMACGLPLVLTDFGGALLEHLEDKKNVIFSSKNPKDLAEKLIFLIKHPKIQKKIGENNRKLIKEKFSKKIFLKNLAQILDQA